MRRWAVGVAVVLISMMWWTAPSSAQVAAPTPSASDPRATFVPGNVVTCAGAGIVSTPGVQVIQLGAQRNNAASDANVSGTVQPHSGGGEELNLTITGANVVIDAVIVKGGAAHNIYTDQAVLPPTLVAPQGYISPFNGGGNVPAISHWIVCYHVTTPLPSGTLQVTKAVHAPNGLPVTPLPTSYSATVNCNDGNPAHENQTVTFGVGGGLQASPPLTGIPEGTVCTVVEVGGAPVVTYIPDVANTTGVTIGATDGVTVEINNDFSEVEVQRGTIRFVKTLVPPPAGVTPPATFTVEIACDDGTTAQVTLPGTGGAGTADVSVRSLSLCAFIEAPSSLPGGWTVTYAVGSGTPSATPPLIPVLDASTLIVNVINDPTAVEPPVPTSTTTTTVPSGPTTTVPFVTTTVPLGPTTTFDGGTGFLPPTGGSDSGLALLAGTFVTAGITLLVVRRRSS